MKHILLSHGRIVFHHGHLVLQPRGRQTNSAAAPVCSYQEPPANPEKLKMNIMHKF